MDILRSLLVFNACRIRPLVAHADAVLAWSKKVGWCGAAGAVQAS